MVVLCAGSKWVFLHYWAGWNFWFRLIGVAWTVGIAAFTYFLPLPSLQSRGGGRIPVDPGPQAGPSITGRARSTAAGVTKDANLPNAAALDR